jgi:hypothetical protein
MTMKLASRAEALFISTLQPSDHPTSDQVAAAVRASLHKYGGSCGCAGACAEEFGDHPDTAKSRMRWALATARQSNALATRAAWVVPHIHGANEESGER